MIWSKPFKNKKGDGFGAVIIAIIMVVLVMILLISTFTGENGLMGSAEALIKSGATRINEMNNIIEGEEGS